MTIEKTLKGGKGSGHHQHAGRPGKKGGSMPGKGGVSMARSGRDAASIAQAVENDPELRKHADEMKRLRQSVFDKVLSLMRTRSVTGEEFVKVNEELDQIYLEIQSHQREVADHMIDMLVDPNRPFPLLKSPKISYDPDRVGAMKAYAIGLLERDGVDWEKMTESEILDRAFGQKVEDIELASGILNLSQNYITAPPPVTLTVDSNGSFTPSPVNKVIIGYADDAPTYYNTVSVDDYMQNVVGRGGVRSLTTLSTAIHEFAHVVEYHSPRIRGETRDFYEEMTGHLPAEIGARTSMGLITEHEEEMLSFFFPDPYMARVYRDNYATTEVFSVACEMLFTNPVGLLESSSETFDYVVGALTDTSSVTTKGGRGSGHHRHAGRPGKQGGSLPGKGGINPAISNQRNIRQIREAIQADPKISVAELKIKDVQSRAQEIYKKLEAAADPDGRVPESTYMPLAEALMDLDVEHLSAQTELVAAVAAHLKSDDPLKRPLSFGNCTIYPFHDENFGSGAFSDVKKGVQSTVSQPIQDVMSCIPKDVLDSDVNERAVKIRLAAIGGGSWYTSVNRDPHPSYESGALKRAQGAITVGALTDWEIDTVEPQIIRHAIHEFGHWIEDRSFTINESINDHYYKATAGQIDRIEMAVLPDGTRRVLYSYKPDKFIEKYSGRTYERQYWDDRLEENVEVFTTEVFSTGIENLFLNPSGFAATAPEHFDAVVSALTGAALETTKGGRGSGHHRHAGRPGKRGGSAPGKGGIGRDVATAPTVVATYSEVSELPAKTISYLQDVLHIGDESIKNIQREFSENPLVSGSYADFGEGIIYVTDDGTVYSNPSYPFHTYIMAQMMLTDPEKYVDAGISGYIYDAVEVLENQKEENTLLERAVMNMEGGFTVRLWLYGEEDATITIKTASQHDHYSELSPTDVAKEMTRAVKKIARLIDKKDYTPLGTFGDREAELMKRCEVIVESRGAEHDGIAGIYRFRIDSVYDLFNFSRATYDPASDTMIAREKERRDLKSLIVEKAIRKAGRFVGYAPGLEDTLHSFEEAATMLMYYLENGEISFSEWKKGMERLNTAGILSAFAGGAGTTVSDLLGREDANEYLERTGIVTEIASQLVFLAGFAAVIGLALGDAFKNGTDPANLPWNKWKSRAVSYGGGTINPYWRGVAAGKGLPFLLPAYPGDGTSQCITTPHSRVLTKRGLVPIKDVVQGDFVWTHRNRWRRVLRTVVSYSAPGRESYAIQSVNGNYVGCTADHEWLTQEGWREASYIYKNGSEMYNMLHDPILRALWESYGKQKQGRDLPDMPLYVRLWKTERPTGCSMRKLRSQAIGCLPVEKRFGKSKKVGGIEKIMAISSLDPREVGGERFLFVPEGRAAIREILGESQVSAQDNNLSLSLGLGAGLRKNPGWVCDTPQRWQSNQRLFGKSYGFNFKGAQIDSYAAPGVGDLPDLSPAFYQEIEGEKTSQKVLFSGVLPPRTPLYDITVEQDHSFTIEGIKVHNCGQYCKCRWDIRSINSEQGDFDCYWVLRPAEHCQTCLERRERWQPLRIRNWQIVMPPYGQTMGRSRYLAPDGKMKLMEYGGFDDELVKEFLIERLKGGRGSGHHQHAGRPGKRGGSMPGKGGVAPYIVNQENFRRWFGKSKVVDADGEPLVVYHGTTHEFVEFSSERGNPDNFFGGDVYYFTDSHVDLQNYAGAGMDYRARTESLWDELEYLNEWSRPELKQAVADALGMSLEEFEKRELGKGAFRTRQYHTPDEIIEKAVNTLMGSDNEGVSIPVYLKMENPFDIRRGGTSLEIRYKNFEEFDEDSPGVRFYQAIQDTLADYGMESEVGGSVFESLLDYGDAQKAFNILRTDFGNSDRMYEQGGKGKFLVAVIKRAGYDGVIMKADDFFRMNTGDATHYIAFEPNQVKSALVNTGEYDPETAVLVKEFLIERLKGGKGSGHHQHAGRPGKRGGSLPGKGGVDLSALSSEDAYRVRYTGYTRLDKLDNPREDVFSVLGDGTVLVSRSPNDRVQYHTQLYAAHILANQSEYSPEEIERARWAFDTSDIEDEPIEDVVMERERAISVRRVGRILQLKIAPPIMSGNKTPNASLVNRALSRIQDSVGTGDISLENIKQLQIVAPGGSFMVDAPDLWNTAVLWDRETQQYLLHTKEITEKGGRGSGHHRHAGRPGFRGGSAPASLLSDSDRPSAESYMSGETQEKLKRLYRPWQIEQCNAVINKSEYTESKTQADGGGKKNRVFIVLGDGTFLTGSFYHTQISAARIWTHAADYPDDIVSLAAFALDQNSEEIGALENAVLLSSEGSFSVRHNKYGGSVIKTRVSTMEGMEDGTPAEALRRMTNAIKRLHRMEDSGIVKLPSRKSGLFGAFRIVDGSMKDGGAYEYAGYREEFDMFSGFSYDAGSHAVLLRTKEQRTEKGGRGSGHHQHAGRPGKRGGSLPGDGGGRSRVVAGVESGAESSSEARYPLTEKEKKRLLAVARNNGEDIPEELRTAFYSMMEKHHPDLRKHLKSLHFCDDDFEFTRLWNQVCEAEGLPQENSIKDVDKRQGGHVMGVCGKKSRTILLRMPVDVALRKPATLHHEMGHLLIDNAPRMWKPWNEAYENYEVDRFSDYSMTNDLEGFAESYMLYVGVYGSGVPRAQPKEVVSQTFEMIEEAIEKLKKS